MNVELPRDFYISSWDKCQTFSFTCRSQQPGRMTVFRKARKLSLLANGKWEFTAGVWIQRTCSFKNVNKQELFLNGSWEMIPGQKTPAGEGWPARFLYGRWELGNGKWEMEHRPVTMDHRKV